MIAETLMPVCAANARICSSSWMGKTTGMGFDVVFGAFGRGLVDMRRTVPKAAGSVNIG
jgi:hypothetical protein